MAVYGAVDGGGDEIERLRPRRAYAYARRSYLSSLAVARRNNYRLGEILQSCPLAYPSTYKCHPALPRCRASPMTVAPQTARMRDLE